jgi:hypothetical protein
VLTTGLERTELTENISFILYLVPLIASAIYALSIWAAQGLSAALPQTVYLTVTKDPYLFLLGFASVCAAVLIELFGSPDKVKITKLTENVRQLQILAIICIATAIISVWSAAGYSPSTGSILGLLLEGRYALIFPLLLFILALLLNPASKFTFLAPSNLMRNSSLILLILSPLIFYGLWRIHMPWPAIIGPTIIIIIAGVALLFYDGTNQADKTTATTTTATESSS